MQIDRTAVTGTPEHRPHCVLECDGCTGLCLAVYMMLTRDEQDEVHRRARDGRLARLN